MECAAYVHMRRQRWDTTVGPTGRSAALSNSATFSSAVKRPRLTAITYEGRRRAGSPDTTQSRTTNYLRLATVVKKTDFFNRRYC